MARLLRDLDYLRLIQADNLAQIIESNEQIKLDTEQSAQAEMISYLSQRYLVNEVFTNTTVFEIASVYNAKSLVEFTSPAFSASATYASGVFRVYNGSVYKSNTAISPAAFNASQWDLICLDKALYFVTLPNSEWNSETSYAIGDEVWYANKVYTCVIANSNIKPTEAAYWGTGVPYTVTGEYPDNDLVWTKGDNRNQQIVMRLIDITLYHLHSRINPRNIPDLRKDRYDGNREAQTLGAIGWLKSVARGDVNADLPVYSPERGLSIRYGNAGTFNEPSKNMMW